jgi:hypothetical protein
VAAPLTAPVQRSTAPDLEEALAEADRPTSHLLVPPGAEIVARLKSSPALHRPAGRFAERSRPRSRPPSRAPQPHERLLPPVGAAVDALEALVD